MIKLVSAYAERPANEWPALFQRILQNTIIDWHRKSTVKNKVFSFFGKKPNAGEKLESDELQEDAIQTAKDEYAKEPEPELLKAAATRRLIDAVADLPIRQQQAFLLRCWEGLSVKETAKAMGCSEGSVKTHYSRALKRLKGEVEGHWDQSPVV